VRLAPSFRPRKPADEKIALPAVLTDVDYNTTSTVWAQDKWKGVFRLKWIYIKDIPSASGPALASFLLAVIG
jgi:hypothetical protein